MGSCCSKEVKTEDKAATAELEIPEPNKEDTANDEHTQQHKLPEAANEASQFAAKAKEIKAKKTDANVHCLGIHSSSMRDWDHLRSRVLQRMVWLVC